ncbi:SH3 domain-containing protein [Oceaniglobus ichthyenteri]|uniref:SH3 domain-containing protein n=1 Tax=Oceaniglobus ichthyenteri TaxID=2136177 RepID=UPI000D338BCA|nr:SH3 domain-containing protein [Oceaniglobus ichthyenteri]
MIRMTLVLLLGIGATMMLYGNDNGVPQGSDAGGMAVTQSNGNTPGLLTRVGSLIEDTSVQSAEVERVPLRDEARAIEIALAATVAPDTPAAAPTRSVQINGQGTAPANTADIWYVTGTRVNLRGGPSTSDAVVGSVGLGQQAEVLEKSDDGWFRIRTADGGQNGYIYGQFLSQDRPG